MGNGGHVAHRQYRTTCRATFIVLLIEMPECGGLAVGTPDVPERRLGFSNFALMVVPTGCVSKFQAKSEWAWLDGRKLGVEHVLLPGCRSVSLPFSFDLGEFSLNP